VHSLRLRKTAVQSVQAWIERPSFFIGQRNSATGLDAYSISAKRMRESTLPRTIDVHNHLFPTEWIDFLGRRSESPRMECKGSVMVFYSHEKMCSHILEPGHYDLTTRIKDMDQCGIDTQVLSLTLPSVEELPVDEGVKWARKINDYFADVSHRYRAAFTPSRRSRFKM
jgi:hypothetical protein